MATDHPNQFETRARVKKALAIADVLTKHHATPETAAELNDFHRCNVAELAGVNPPSDKTWELVVAILTERQRRDDPLAGIA